MKRLFLLILTFLCCSLCFCVDYNVGILPDNEQLATLIKENFLTVSVSNELKDFLSLSNNEIELNVNIIKPESKYYEDLLLTFDKNYLNLVCDRNNICLLLIPVIKGQTQLYVYNRVLEEYSMIYKEKTNSDKTFSLSVLSKLLPYFSYNTQQQTITVKENTVYNDPILINCINSDASVYINGQYVGDTPLTVNSYTLPLNFIVKNEGFADRVISVNQYVPEISVELKELAIDANSKYLNSKSKFYKALSNTLILIGVNSALNSFIPQDTKASTISNIIMKSFIATSGLDTGLRLIQYYKSGKNLVP